MYRLLMLRVYPMYLTPNFSIQANCHPSRIMCACGNYICKLKAQVPTVIPINKQTTFTKLSPMNVVKKKKRIRKMNKYTELIEVTGTSSCEKRAKVSKLKAKDLNRLVHPPEAASMIPTGRKKPVPMELLSSRAHALENWESKNCEGMLELTMELGEEDLDPLAENIDTAPLLEGEPFESEKVNNMLLEDDCSKLQHESDSAFVAVLKKGKKKKIKGSRFSPNKQKQVIKKQEMTKGKKEEPFNKTVCKSEPNKAKFSKYEQAAREESFIQSLLSYLDSCVYCGFLNRGMNALMFYRARGKRSEGHSSFRLHDTRPYEVLLHGYAAKKNISKVEELMKMMQEDHITPTAQCYAACFECLSRKLCKFTDDGGANLYLNSDPDSLIMSKLNMFASEMLEKGISLNDLFAKTCLLSDQKKIVMEAVLKLDPNFSPVWPPSPEFGYKCRLLQSLNQPESQNTYSSPVSGLLTSEELKRFTMEQLETELKDCLEVKSIEARAEPNETILFYRERLKESQEEWRQVILSALSRDLQSLQYRSQKGGMGNRSMNLYPFLVSLDKEELVELVLQEIRKLAEGSETFSPTTNQLYRELGSRILERYQVRWKEKNGVLEKVKHLYGKYCEWFADPKKNKIATQPVTCTRQAWQSLVHSHQAEGASLNFGERNWPITVQIGIGKFLYDIILREIRVDVNISRPSNKKSHLLPAFYTLFRSQQQGKILKEEVKPHPALARLFRAAASDTLKFPARCLPMLCPPTPWTTVLSGAYLLTKADVIRLPPQGMLQWNRLVNCPTQQLYPALDSLNQLGAVPWKVNKSVLDVVIEVFNSGGSSQLSIPAPPSSFTSQNTAHLEPSSSSPTIEASEPPSQVNSADLRAERLKLNRQRLYLRRKRAEAYSLWCDTLYRLSLANHFRDRIFWLPHNMDFRGRVYPCPPHLNHLGSDIARSLLCFARGQPLGPKGLDWLKLHLVNLTGIMKHNPINERMTFADQIMPEILDSAENPLTGRMWWAKSEEPWQTLAACMEIASALKADTGPENYICHFPVHQDGSCNGLQHYAALGRDAAGAASVSMAPSECPQDVYGVVASMVERERAADAELGIDVARVLNGFVRRKVIKQTVMTTVYGVTRFGARLQIARQLRDIEDFPKEYVWRGSSYLVGKTFGCLREMFTSTKEIQDWFTECARLISQVCGRSVEWVTPLGLPVVQPYNKVIGSKRYGSGDPLSAGYLKVPYGVVGNYERPNVMKQKNAFPPNFIHSIDSSHMMLTSLQCERKGLTFVAVHDCYWTHPSSVETMNQICREQFVSLHSDPILEDLSAFLVQNYSYPEDDLSGDDDMDSAKKKLNQILTQVPKKGDFDLRNVLDSVYFFS